MSKILRIEGNKMEALLVRYNAGGSYPKWILIPSVDGLLNIKGIVCGSKEEMLKFSKTMGYIVFEDYKVILGMHFEIDEAQNEFNRLKN